MLAYHKPVDPKKFILEELKKRKNKTNSRFFTEDELAGYFGTIQKGHAISKETFLEASACLRSRDDTRNLTQSETIDKNEFVKLMKEETF
jgi:hypothetical protein